MMTDRPPGKISLFGMFGVGNLGNEATLQAMLHNVRRFLPNAEVSCICAGPEAAAQDYCIPAYLIREFPLPPLNSQKLRLLRKILSCNSVGAVSMANGCQEAKEHRHARHDGNGDAVRSRHPSSRLAL